MTNAIIILSITVLILGYWALGGNPLSLLLTLTVIAGTIFIVGATLNYFTEKWLNYRYPKKPQQQES